MISWTILTLVRRVQLDSACSYSDVLVGVVAATVNVLCELAPQNPRDYLPLAPHLFHLLTTSSNNWMLIKIIKLVRHAVFLRGSILV